MGDTGKTLPKYRVSKAGRAFISVVHKERDSVADSQRALPL